MNLVGLLTAEWVQRLGWMLLHSLWELTLVAGGLAIILAKARRSSGAAARYGLACGAMALMVALPVITALCVEPHVLLPGHPAAGHEGDIAEMQPSSPPDHAAPTTTPSPQLNAPSAAPLPSAVPAKPASIWIDQLSLAVVPWFPWLVLAWLAGAATLALYQFGGWLSLQRLRRLATPLAQNAVLAQFHALTSKMHIGRSVRLLTSSLVDSPVTLGWLKPVILLPAALLSGLSPQQIEAILAHELAHVRRLDYLVNLAQTAVETLLFYHPAVWWVSRRIRLEREHCCDDAALAICQNPVAYADALTSLEAARAAGILALAAAGTSPSTMVQRVRRVLGLAPAAPPTLAGARLWTGSMLGTMLLACLFSGAAAEQYALGRQVTYLRHFSPDYVAALHSPDLRHSAKLLSLIRPAITAEPRAAATFPLGASRIGGQPDLPPEIPWPTWKDRPQVFVAQINLEELPDVPGRELLPARGHLYFFYAMACDDHDEMPYGDDPKHAGAAPVLYSSAPTAKLVRRAFPDTIDPDRELKPQPLLFSVRNTIPDFEHPAWRRIAGGKPDGYESVIPQAWEKMEPPVAHYQILGHPMPMQTSVCWEAESGSTGHPTDWDKPEAGRKAEEWELLFQALDLFGEESIYYLIRREDLRHQRWDRSWFVIQAT